MLCEKKHHGSGAFGAYLALTIFGKRNASLAPDLLTSSAVLTACSALADRILNSGVLTCRLSWRSVFLLVRDAPEHHCSICVTRMHRLVVPAKPPFDLPHHALNTRIILAQASRSASALRRGMTSHGAACMRQSLAQPLLLTIQQGLPIQVDFRVVLYGQLQQDKHQHSLD